MEANQEFGLEEVCFESHAPVKSDIPSKACFKDIKDLEFEGMPDKYTSCYMARMQGSRYLLNVDAGSDCYIVDTNTLSAKKAHIGNHIRDLANCFIDAEYMLLVGFSDKMAIFRGLRYIGQIEFQAKAEGCKNDAAIYGRYVQQVGQTVYAVDDDGGLYRIEWKDILKCIDHKELIKRDVENLHVDKILGMAIIDRFGTLYLDNEVEVDLKKVNTEAKWTIVTCISKCWIVSGDHKDKTVMANISKKGDIRSTLKLKLTSNGYKNWDGRKYTGIYALRKVYVTGM